MNNYLSRLVNFANDQKLVCLLLVSGILRFVNLGYSDFQGDEIKALFLLSDFKSLTAISQFLLSQRKGPLQFLITFIIKSFDPNYENQFLVRLPFAVAGFLAVFYFYKFVQLHFGGKIAFYASLLLASNGFFIAFSRIAQYQSFVILFSVVVLYMLSLATTNIKYKSKGVVLAGLYAALALLAHYDSIFIAPFALFLLIKWYKNTDLSNKNKKLALLASLLIFSVLSLSFYLPFARFVTENTKSYWSGRLTGEVSDKLSSSTYLFSVYQPIYSLHFYRILMILGLTLIFMASLTSLSKKSELAGRFKDYFGTINYQTALAIILSWILPTFLFWEFLVAIPGTHIYTYLLPSFIVIAFGVKFAEHIWYNLTKKSLKALSAFIRYAGLIILFAFLCLQSFYIFVDHTKEYPWESKKFLIWELHEPTPVYHLSMFGFPYFRDWEGIGRFVRNYDNVRAYSTNERESISRHYISLEKDTDKAGFYVYIRHPQSFTDNLLNEKVLYWANSHTPVYTMSKNGSDLVNIYLMPEGNLEKINAGVLP